MSKQTTKMRAAIDQKREVFGNMWAILDAGQRNRITKRVAATKIDFPLQDDQLIEVAASLFILDLTCSIAEQTELEQSQIAKCRKCNTTPVQAGDVWKCLNCGSSWPVEPDK